MRALHRAAVVGALALTGCGDSVAGVTSDQGTSGGSTSTGDAPTTSGAASTTTDPPLPACQEGDSVWVASTLAACVDAACSELLADSFEAVATDSEYEVYADVELECRIDGMVAQDGEQWTLTECTGDQAPASGALRISFTSNQDLGLPLVIGERVRVAFHGGTTFGNEHRSWSLRRTDDTLLAPTSFGIFLPPASLTAPIALSGQPQPCGDPSGCGGYAGRSDLMLELAGQTSTVPDDATGVLTGTPSYRVAVALASYEGPSGCGVLGWRESYIFAVIADL